MTTSTMAKPKLSKARVFHAIAWRAHLASEFVKRKLGTQPVFWSRVVMDRETDRFVRSLGPESKDALEISGDKWKDFGFASYRSANYPEYDFCEGTLDATYDLIIAEQVLEHALWPYRAARNMRAMLRPGGVLVITTPFLVRIHECPVDCSRWTELGLRQLLAEAGFDASKIITGGWGNKACVRANFRYWFPRWNPYIHSLRNEPEFPVHVWAFAKND
jgi:SAM-dependent methyltransferase